MSSTRPTLSQALGTARQACPDPRQGLPEELFLFATTITPMVNVDLLVRDDTGRILLSWRNDPWCGQGWHVPGGIVRFQERLLGRLQKTALAEFGCEVTLEKDQPDVTEFIRQEGPRERSHFVSFIYHCRLPGDRLPPQKAQAGEAGYLAFHEQLPEDIIPVHQYYRRYFRS